MNTVQLGQKWAISEVVVADGSNKYVGPSVVEILRFVDNPIDKAGDTRKWVVRMTGSTTYFNGINVLDESDILRGTLVH